jgi:hypothetical protein
MCVKSNVSLFPASLRFARTRLLTRFIQAEAIVDHFVGVLLATGEMWLVKILTQ